VSFYSDFGIRSDGAASLAAENVSFYLVPSPLDGVDVGAGDADATALGKMAKGKRSGRKGERERAKTHGREKGKRPGKAGGRRRLGGRCRRRRRAPPTVSRISARTVGGRGIRSTSAFIRPEASNCAHWPLPAIVPPASPPPSAQAVGKLWSNPFPHSEPWRSRDNIDRARRD
jgi:hypothetical protein